MTVTDPDGKIRRLMANGAEMDALRMRNGEPPVFGSLREVIEGELNRSVEALGNTTDNRADS